MPVAYSIAALKQLRRLPAKAREQIIEKIHRYATTGAGEVKSLVGRPGRRLRVGRYRVIFVEGPEGMLVLAVGDRRDVYR